jgi:hypothetical protein
VVGVQVALSVLNSIVAMATLSEAVPTTVTSADRRTVSFGGDRMVTCGGIWSTLRTATERVVVATSPWESRICKVTGYDPAVEKTCWAVSKRDHGVSHRPSPSQSQRASRVAFGSESEEEDASKRTELFATGAGGEYVKRAVGPGPVTVTMIDVACDKVPLVPVTVTVYDPGVVPLIVHVEVWVPLILDGRQEVVTPAGEEASASDTVPVKPPVDCREIVEVAD